MFEASEVAKFSWPRASMRGRVSWLSSRSDELRQFCPFCRTSANNPRPLPGIFSPCQPLELIADDNRDDNADIFDDVADDHADDVANDLDAR